jgi:hypothetical protein
VLVRGTATAPTSSKPAAARAVAPPQPPVPARRRVLRHSQADDAVRDGRRPATKRLKTTATKRMN